MSYHFPGFLIVTVSVLVLFQGVLFAAEPEENTIPILAMRTASGADFSRITLSLLCELSWKHFDGVDVGGPVVDGSVDPEMSWAENREFMEYCGRVGLLLSLAPWELCQYYNPWNVNTAHWFRWTEQDLDSDSCFGQLNYDLDSLVAVMSAEDMADTLVDHSLASTVQDVANVMQYYPALWFYNVYDEAPGWQRRRMISETSPWDDYIPNICTQDRDSITNIPTLAEVEPSGIFSWTKWLAEHDSECSVPTTTNLVLIHSIVEDEYSDWGGNQTCDFCHGSLEQHADMVSAVCEMMYQAPPDSNIFPQPEDNSPGFICLDDYPFRYVDIEHADSTTICDDDWLFLIDHYEEALDTTVITAKEYGIPVHLYLQTFGAAGGSRMLDTVSLDLDYPHFLWRSPTPAEVRMYAGLALLHQVKGLYLYSLGSYIEYDGGNFISSALLDMNSIPFDAPYEDWVYTGRWPYDNDTLEYADPRYLPPFSEGFDPLYELSIPPSPIQGDPKNTERFMTWFFEPYGRLYREIGDILGEVAVIAPEMSGLWWWDGEENRPEIEAAGSIPLLHYVSPRIRMLQHSGNNHAYLFYVNRFLRGESFRYSVSVSDIGFQGYLSTSALDHGRRCLVPVAVNSGVYSLLDTLGPGQTRLLEFVNPSAAFQADIRVTSPDVFAIREDSTERTDRFVCTTGETITLGAVFYNMGTSSTGNVRVTFVNVSNASSPDTLGSDAFRLSGLSGWFSPDSASASIDWSPGADCAGPNIIEISAGSVLGENTSDNTVRVVVLVDPLDYATEVLGNAWDMNEVLSNPPDWFTPDIVSVAAGWDDSCWTDSVSGMFEGEIESRSYGDWAGYRGDICLNTDSGSIDADQYAMLSLAGVSLREDTSGVDFGCGMFLFWKDARETEYFLELHDPDAFGQGLGLGREMWREFGPLDLPACTTAWSGEVHDVGIRFQMDPPSLSPPPLGIRIGWIRLEGVSP